MRSGGSTRAASSHRTRHGVLVSNPTWEEYVVAEGDGNNQGTGNQGGSAGTGDTDRKAEADKWKQLARKHEDQAKANHAELQRLQQASDSSKSDMDKLRDEVAKLTKQAEESELKALKAEVAQEKGLTAKQARRLSGTTRAELEADADELIETFGVKRQTSDTDDGDGDQKAGGQQNGEDGQNGSVGQQGDTSGGSAEQQGGRRPRSQPKDPNAPGGGSGGSGEEGFDPKKVADEIFGDN